MSKENQKIIYLDIKAIKFPVTAIASILHRISGFFLFIAIGPILWLLNLSLSSEAGFYIISNLLLKNNYIFKFLAWIMMIILSYHMIFGIRQILMDFGCIKQTLSIGRISANIVFMLVIFLSVYIGIYIW